MLVSALAVRMARGEGIYRLPAKRIGLRLYAQALNINLMRAESIFQHLTYCTLNYWLRQTETPRLKHEFRPLYSQTECECQPVK
jgi:hypothetical protein